MSTTQETLSRKDDFEMQLITIEQNTAESKLLTQPAKLVQFPLSKEIQIFIDKMLKEVVDRKAAGFAASQFGQHLQIIVYRVSELSIEARSLDPSEAFPLTVLINPSYEGIEEAGKNNDDWEGCYSVEKICGKPVRYNNIRYEGFNLKGEKVQGTATGFRARLLQHEIDHAKGILFTERLTRECIQGTPEEMKLIREKEYAERKEQKAQAKKSNTPGFPRLRS